jgi:hypothetical protein
MFRVQVFKFNPNASKLIIINVLEIRVLIRIRHTSYGLIMQTHKLILKSKTEFRFSLTECIGQHKKIILFLLQGLRHSGTENGNKKKITKASRDMCSFEAYCHLLVIRRGVWNDGWIYWTLIARTYKFSPLFGFHWSMGHPWNFPFHCRCFI